MGAGNRNPPEMMGFGFSLDPSYRLLAIPKHYFLTSEGQSPGLNNHQLKLVG
jgi:hypothetical protein